MRQVDNLTADANQLTQVLLDDGTTIQLQLVYMAAIQRWVATINHDDDFEVDNLVLCAHPNILREFRNVISFGICIIATDGLDPIFIDDFTSGRCTIFILNLAEVLATETHVFAVTS